MEKTRVATSDPILERMIQRLVAAAGTELESVVLYGPAARGDAHPGKHYHLIVIVAELSPASLALLAGPIRWWLDRGQPMPRLFSIPFIAASADVFPMELLDIAQHRQVLHGSDPFADLAIDTSHLRLQCERELRAKMMRLCEGFAETLDRRRALDQLLVASYIDFADVFRGCLYLRGETPPARSAEVVTRFCERAGIEPEPFRAVERLARGERQDAVALFARYHAALSRAVEAVDRFTKEEGEDAS
jgi:hypothetical protein